MAKKYKILMATMGLNIGGAETHIVELSKELKKNGYDIIVSSNGGVYVEELTNSGIKHYNVPLNTKNFKSVTKSLKLLSKIIKEENVEIVHSHARIPGFITGILHRSMDFTFVTSAHWVFNTGNGLKYLTNWGQKVIAVSEDIKQYLMDKNRLGKLQGKKLKKFAGGFAASIGVSLGAMVLTTPLCAYYFGVVSLVSPLTNLLTLWIITFIFPSRKSH